MGIQPLRIADSDPNAIRVTADGSIIFASREAMFQLIGQLAGLGIAVMLAYVDDRGDLKRFREDDLRAMQENRQAEAAMKATVAANEVAFDATGRVAALTAEVERLRAALEEADQALNSGDQDYAIVNASYIVSAALAEQGRAAGDGD